MANPTPPDDAEDYVRRAISAAVFGIPSEAIPAVQAQVTALISQAEQRGARIALDELLTAANGKARMGHDNGTACVLALVDMRAKYQPKEPSR